MKTRNYYFLAFIVMCLAQWWVTGELVYEHRSTIARGVPFKFRVAPVDPTDPFRGKFVALAYRDNFYLLRDSSLGMKEGQEVYVTFKPDEEGFAIINQWSSSEPTATVPYLKVLVDRIEQEAGFRKIFVKYPFDRFYLEEAKAPAAEERYRALTGRDGTEAWSVVYIDAGKAVLHDVLLEGISLSD